MKWFLSLSIAKIQKNLKYHQIIMHGASSWDKNI